jgi:hypothetical protein
LGKEFQTEDPAAGKGKENGDNPEIQFALISAAGESADRFHTDSEISNSWGRLTLRTEIRMDAEEIGLLDRENALLELEQIVRRVRAMAGMSYDLEIGEVWEYLDIWSAAGNAEAKRLLVALKSALARMGHTLEPC